MVATDLAIDEMQATRDTFAAMYVDGELSEETAVLCMQANGLKMPFPDESFDRIIVSEVLEHVPDDLGVMAELFRLLKRGGRMAATVPSAIPEQICWWINDEYHAPKSVGGHVRIYHQPELRTKLESVGFKPGESHRAHALAQPLLVAEMCRRGRQRRQPVGQGLSETAHLGHRGRRRRSPAPPNESSTRSWARAWSSTPTGRDLVLMQTPSVPGLLTADDLLGQSGQTIADLQLPSGMIEWFPGGHADPWNHVETAMALATVGFTTAAERAYQWLIDIQLPNGGWHNYYLADGIEDSKLDTNCVAYFATGVWHHYLVTGDQGFLEHCWPTLRRAIDFVLTLQRPGARSSGLNGPTVIRGAIRLLTGSSSISHSLRCAIEVATTLRPRRRDLGRRPGNGWST